MKGRVKIGDATYVSAQIVRGQFGISYPTLRSWELNGILPPSVRLGNHRYYRRDDLERGFAANTVTGGGTENGIAKPTS